MGMENLDDAGVRFLETKERVILEGKGRRVLLGGESMIDD
jgi:hypothetical protein